MKKTSKIQPRPIKRSEKIGVLDIGSNSIRLVIYKGMDRDPIPVFNEKKTIVNLYKKVKI